MTNMEIPSNNTRVAMADYNNHHQQGGVSSSRINATGHHEKHLRLPQSQCDERLQKDEVKKSSHGNAVPATGSSRSVDDGCKGNTSSGSQPHHTTAMHENQQHRIINNSSHHHTESSIRRSSSLGLSLLSEFDMTHFNETIPPPPPVHPSGNHHHSPTSERNNSSQQQQAPTYRPMVGSGTADAFEALRHDYYVQQQEKQHQHQLHLQEQELSQKIARQKRRMSSLSFGSAKAAPSPAMYGGNSSSNNNVSNSNRSFFDEDRQYEMLKLHHLNLMNEIQETALMLNLYEQKQLLRQQQEQMRQLQELRMLEERERHTGSGDRASGHHGRPPQRSPQPSLQEMDRTTPVTVGDKRQLNPEQGGNERGSEQQQLVAMAENKRLKVQ